MSVVFFFLFVFVLFVKHHLGQAQGWELVYLECTCGLYLHDFFIIIYVDQLTFIDQRHADVPYVLLLSVDTILILC